MRTPSLTRTVASLVALVLGTGLAVTTSTLVASAATDAAPAGQCIVEVIKHDAVDAVTHEEFRYTQVIPGTTETFHTEYRFRTRTVTHGTVEHKYIYSGWDFVSGGQTTIDGDVVSGHWVNTGTAFWHAIPDSVINAVWGVGGVPDAYVGGTQANPKGSVSLSNYGFPTGNGYPNPAPNVSYYAAKVTEDTGYTAWGPWSAWSTKNPGAETLTFDVDTDTEVSDGNVTTPASTLFYVKNGPSTATAGATNWTTETLATVQALDAAWKFYDDRTVTDSQAVAAYDEVKYGTCPTPPSVSCLANANAAGTDLVLPAITDVAWKVNGAPAVAGPISIPLASADVTVEAVPTGLATQFGPGQTTWTFDAGPDGLCQQPTLAQFPTNVTHTDEQCMNGKLQQGTITVGVVGGTSFFTNEVDYFLDGSAARMTQQTVSLAPGTYAVTAAPHDPNDTLQGSVSWPITIVGVSTICSDLTTLALTGAGSAAPWALLALLLLTAGTTTLAVRASRRPKGAHRSIG
jgi:hypothetical protein